MTDMEIDKISQALMIAFIGDVGCTLTNADCNDLTKYISGLKGKIAAYENDLPLLKATERIAELEAENAALREANRWIPVGERLPLPTQKREGCCSLNSSDLVHVYPAPRNDRAVVYMHYLEKWSCSAEVEVTHWRPLPEPPEEEQK